MDFALLKKSMTKHSSGLYLLPRPSAGSEDAAASRDPRGFPTRAGTTSKASFTQVILDLSKAYSPLDMAALDK